MRLLLAVVLAMILLAGCSQETSVEQAEEEAGVEELVEEETTESTSSPDGARGEGPSGPSDKAKAMKAGEEAQAKNQAGLSTDNQERLDVGTCQGEEMLADLGPERAQRTGDEIVQEVVAGEFENIQEAYAARGYTCGGRYEEAFGQ